MRAAAAGGQLERLGAVSRIEDVIPLVGQHLGDQAAEGLVIFNDQHAPCVIHPASLAAGAQAVGTSAYLVRPRTYGAPSRRWNSSATNP